MSYDICFMRLAPGEDPAAVFSELMEEEEAASVDSSAPVDPETQAAMHRLADAVVRRIPALEQFQPSQPLPWIELTDRGLGLQLLINPAAVNLTVAYFREGDEILDRLCECIKIVCEEGGFTAYDPQLGREIDARDFSTIRAGYRSMDAKLPGIVAQQKPWWKFWA
jgi:hypothetical protein